MGTIDELIEQYKQEAQGLALAPSPRVWENVDREINGRGRRKRLIFLFILLGFLSAWGLYFTASVRGTGSTEVNTALNTTGKSQTDKQTNTIGKSQTDKQANTVDKSPTGKQTNTVDRSQTSKQTNSADKAQKNIKLETRPLLAIVTPGKPTVAAQPADVPAAGIRWPRERVSRLGHSAASSIPVATTRANIMQPLQQPTVQMRWSNATVEKLRHRPAAALPVTPSAADEVATMPQPSLPELSIRYVPEQINSLGYHAAQLPAAGQRSAHRAGTLLAPGLPHFAITTGEEPVDKLPHSTAASLPASTNKTYDAQPQHAPALPGGIFDAVPGEPGNSEAEQTTTPQPRITYSLPPLPILPIAQLYTRLSTPAADNVLAATPPLPDLIDITTQDDETATEDNHPAQSRETTFIAQASAAGLIALAQPATLLSAQPVAVGWPLIDIVEEQPVAENTTTSQTAAEKDTTGKKKSRWSLSLSFIPARNNMTLTEQGDYQFVKNYRDSTDGRLTSLNYALHAHYRLNSKVRLDMGLGLNTVGETISKHQAVYRTDSVVVVSSVWTGTSGGYGPTAIVSRSHYNIDNDSTGRRANKLTYLGIDAGVTCDLLTAGRFTAGIQTLASLGRLVRSDVQYYNTADSVYSKAGNGELRPFVWSASLGAVLSYRISNRCSISLTPGYRKYVTSVLRPALGTAQDYEQWSLRMSLIWDL